MKNIIKFICFSICFISLTFSSVGCSVDNPPNDNKQIELTSTEVIAEAKNKLVNKFSNTTIYTDITLPTYYLIEDKYNVYISWESSNNSIINPISGNINRTLSLQTCTLTATLLYKELTDSKSFELSIPANIYEDTTNTFPKKDSVEIKVSYMSINDTLKLKIKLANNNNSKIIYGVKSITFSIRYSGYKYLVKGITYTNTSTKQFSLQSGKCIEIEMPEISKNSLLTDYLIDTSYYCEISSLSYYNYNGSVTHVFY